MCYSGGMMTTTEQDAMWDLFTNQSNGTDKRARVDLVKAGATRHATADAYTLAGTIYRRTS